MIRAHSRSRLKNPAAGGGASFAPASLFAAGEQGVWLDPSDLSTMFQDSPGTTPVTAAGQPVGLILDKSGRGNNASQATAGSRPILRNSGALWYLEFDGVDDFLVTGSIGFTIDKMSVFSGMRKTSDAAIGIAAELSVSTATNNGTFAMYAPGTDGGNSYVSRNKGTIAVDLFVTPYIAPISNVLALSLDVGAKINAVRVNGVSAGSSAADQGTGNFGSYPLYIGRRGGTSNPFVGNIYGLIVRGAASSASDITNAEQYLASKTGISF